MGACSGGVLQVLQRMEEGYSDGETEDCPGVRGGEVRLDSLQDRTEGDITSVEGYPNIGKGDRHCRAIDDNNWHLVHPAEELPARWVFRENDASQGAFRDQGREISG